MSDSYVKGWRRVSMGNVPEHQVKEVLDLVLEAMRMELWQGKHIVSGEFRYELREFDDPIDFDSTDQG